MYIKVKVIPASKKESVVKKGEDRYTIAVREKAEQNRANKRMLELLAQELNTPLGNIRIINGHHSPSKLLSIREL